VWETGAWSQTLKGQNFGPIQLKGYHSSIAVREGGVWKKRLLMWNITPAPAATPVSGGQSERPIASARLQIRTRAPGAERVERAYYVYLLSERAPRDEKCGRLRHGRSTNPRWPMLSIFRFYAFPYMDRSNLTVLTNALVTRLTFESKRATGMEIAYNGKVHRMGAGLEVVLSLGAINRPKVLMQSGRTRRGDTQTRS